MIVIRLQGKSLSRIAIGICITLIALAGIRVALPGGEQRASTQTVSAATKKLPIYSVARDDKTVALTFDAAWGAEKTGEILDILDAKDVKATFFLVGFWVDKYPDRVRDIAARGHVIGNHSTNHPHMPTLTKDDMLAEIQTTSDKIEELTGARPTLFRPPFGDYDAALLSVCDAADVKAVQWDVDSLDWKEKGVDHLINRVVGKTQNGSIVLFHNNSAYITQALPVIIDRLIADGYRMTTVPELLLDGDTYIDHEGRQRLQ